MGRHRIFALTPKAYLSTLALQQTSRTTQLGGKRTFAAARL